MILGSITLEILKGLLKYSSLDVAEVCNTFKLQSRMQTDMLYQVTLYEIHGTKCSRINLRLPLRMLNDGSILSCISKLWLIIKRSHTPLPYEGNFILALRHF